MGSRVRATSRAAWVSLAIGRIARRATANPARKASTVPPITPNARKARTRLMVCCTLLTGLAYCTNPATASSGASKGAKLWPRRSAALNSGLAATR